ncbi:MAG TPA: hypothetical protein VHC67_16150 [Gaiellaceae bacterium]|nr:hypothetical protein [Gaiellaceae bacterium]
MATRTRSALAPVAVAAVLVAALTAAIAWGGTGTGQISVASAATEQFHSLGAAKGAGYALLKDKNGVACIAMDSMPGMGAMGVHYAKSGLVADGKLNVRHPEALVYAPAAGGKLELAAVEYVVLKQAWDARHASRPVLFGHGFNETPAGNRFGLPAYYSLHVWLWQHNPSGLFSMWNPEVSCK